VNHIYIIIYYYL